MLGVFLPARTPREIVDKLSSEAIKLSVQEPGKLIPALAVFDNVSAGKVEAGYTWMGYEIGKLPASALFGATPFGLEPDEYIAGTTSAAATSWCASSTRRTTSCPSSAARSGRRPPAGSSSRSRTSSS